VSLKEIEKAGFRAVMPKDERNPHFKQDVQNAQEMGFEIPFIHASSKEIDQLWAEGSAKKRCLGDTMETIKYCGKQGIKTMVLHPVFGDPVTRPNPPCKQGLKSFTELVKAASDNDVKIAIENVAGGKKHLEFLLDNIVSEYLKFCWDTGHNRHYDKFTDFMKKYGDRLGAVHINDTNATWKPGQDHSFDFHMLPGDGDIDFVDVGTKIAESNYTGPIMLETIKFHMSDKLRKYDNLSTERYLDTAYKRAKDLSDLTTRKHEEVHNGKE
jgi:sugar phosphate isomerase/epimerase